MGNEAKLVDNLDEWTATITVHRGQKVLINPNGRGYDDDNKIITDQNTELEVTVKATSPTKLAAKIAVIMDTLENIE